TRCRISSGSSPSCWSHWWQAVSSLDPVRRLARRVKPLLGLFLGLALAACNQQQPWWQPLGFLGNLPRPFQPDRHEGDPRFVVTPGQAGIVVQPIAGFQPETAQEVAEAIVRALQALNYPASTGHGNAASYVMAGRIAGEA